MSQKEFIRGLLRFMYFIHTSTYMSGQRNTGMVYFYNRVYQQHFKILQISKLLVGLLHGTSTRQKWTQYILNHIISLESTCSFAIQYLLEITRNTPLTLIVLITNQIFLITSTDRMK